MTVTPSVEYAATPYGQLGVAVNLDITMPGVTLVDVIRHAEDGSALFVRASNPIALESGQVTVVDRETPLDLSFSYEVRQIEPVGSLIETSVATRIDSLRLALLRDPTQSGGYVVIHTLTSIVDITRAARATTLDIIGRAAPVVVSTVRSSGAGVLVFHTATNAERTMVNNLCASGRTLLLSVPYGYAQPNNVYLAVDSTVEERVGLAMEPARKFTLPFQSVDRPLSYPTDKLGPSWATVYGSFADWNEVKFIDPILLDVRLWSELKDGSR